MQARKGTGLLSWVNEKALVSPIISILHVTNQLLIYTKPNFIDLVWLNSVLLRQKQKKITNYQHFFNLQQIKNQALKLNITY